MPSDAYYKAGAGFGTGLSNSVERITKELAERRKQKADRQSELEKAAIGAGTATYDPTTQRIEKFKAPSIEELQAQYPGTVFYPSSIGKGGQPTISGIPREFIPGYSATDVTAPTELGPTTPTELPPFSIGPEKASVENIPAATPFLRGARAVQRGLGMDPVARHMTADVTARGAQLAKVLGDTGNIAFQERVMSTQVAPLDGDSDVERKNKRARWNADVAAEEQSILTQLGQLDQNQMRVAGFSGRAGVQIRPDPAVDATRRDLTKRLSGLRIVRDKMNEWYDEADALIPAIGSKNPRKAYVPKSSQKSISAPLMTRSGMPVEVLED